MHPHPQLSKQSEEFQSMGGHQTPGCCQKTLRWGVDMHGVRTVLPPPQGLNQEIWYSHHGCGCGGTYPKTTVYVPAAYNSARMPPASSTRCTSNTKLALVKNLPLLN